MNRSVLNDYPAYDSDGIKRHQVRTGKEKSKHSIILSSDWQVFRGPTGLKMFPMIPVLPIKIDTRDKFLYIPNLIRK